MCCNTQKRRRRGSGFSFLEVMVVVVIIGLLAGAVAIKVSDYIDKARVNRAKTDMAVLAGALETYKGFHGKYPSNEEGLSVLPLQKNTKGIDPWGRPYLYRTPGQNGEGYDLVCLGADGREGGDGIDADITEADLE